MQPDQHQAGAIENSKDQADQSLTADKTGNGGVYLARQRANGFPMRPRHPIVHGHQHAVPVQQQIESHDRGNHDERNHRNERLAAGPQRGKKSRQPSGRRGGDAAKRLLRVRQPFPDDPAEPSLVRLGDKPLHPLDVARQPFDETAELFAQERNDDDDNDYQGRDEHHDDDDRGKGATDAKTLNELNEGIEQIGERHTGDKGQQHIAEQPQHRNQYAKRREPENELTLERHTALFLQHCAGRLFHCSDCALTAVARLSRYAASIPRHRRRWTARSRLRRWPCPAIPRRRHQSESQAMPAPDKQTRSAPRY